MSVRAQFWVQKVTKQAASGGEFTRTVELAPVVRSTGQPGYNPEGNIDWSKYTPSGRVELTITKDGAGEWFEERIGKDVAITFDDVAPGE
jgi:hypothetical protein